MSKELTPLEAYKRFRNNLQWLEENVANLKSYFENEELHFNEDLDIIETALEDLEWLKHKLNLMFLNSLSSPEDKERVMKIMGVEYDETYTK